MTQFYQYLCIVIMTTSIAECSANFKIVENKKAKSTVWQHFGFVKEKDEVSKKQNSLQTL